MTASTGTLRHSLLSELTTIQAALQLLERGASLSEEQRRFVAAGLRAVYHLADQIRAACPDPDTES